MTDLTIGNSVETIGGYSFSGCYSLAEITIPVKVNAIDDCAFALCWDIQSINCEPPTPPTLYSKQTFFNYDANLNVPVSCSDKYINAAIWSDFKNIQEVPFATIDEISNHNNPIFNILNGYIVINDSSAVQSLELYDISGTKIYTGNEKQIIIPGNGIFILKINDKAYKIFN